MSKSKIIVIPMFCLSLNFGILNLEVEQSNL